MQTSETVHPEHTQREVLDGHAEIGHVLGFRIEPTSVWFQFEKAQAILTFPMDTVMRFKASISEETLTLESTLAISYVERPVIPSIEHHADGLVLRTRELCVEVKLDPFAIRVTDVSGRVVYQTQSITHTEQGSLLFRHLCTEDDHFYGLGEKTSFLDKRGEAYDMWNSDVYDPHVPELDALYVSIPFLIHAQGGKASGVFLDNPGRSRFDMRSHQDSYGVLAMMGDFDMYVLAGPSPQHVVQQYTTLTGRISMPPKWAIGYHQSRYSYMSDQEVLDIAKTMRAKQIPCDAMYLDIHYMDGYRVFTFHPDRFPNPQALSNELTEMGIRLVTIVDPGVKQDPGYWVYDDGTQHDVFCRKPDGNVFIGDVWPGPSAFPDFTDASVRTWWANHQKFYLNHGISGIWNDMNEPAVFNDIKTMELDVVHRNDGHPKSHEEAHNLYGLMMCRATHEGLRAHQPEKRPFVLTRAGYAGIQRYAAVWTGDNRSYWEHLALSIPMLLNLGLSGVPFSGVDIGGFAHHASGELLARWTEVGVFFPFCRNHSAVDTLRQEPWSFGPDIEDICKKYISLRYQWMPHIYSLFRETSVTGIPWLRPLLLEYPEDTETHNLCDEFLVGKDVLVAPVYRPDMNHRAVYLPAGRWYDYWTGVCVEGGQHILAKAPLDILPLYVREGAILPTQNQVQSTAEAPTGPATLHLYVGGYTGTTTYQLYDDDGETLDYERGVYALTTLSLTASEEIITFHAQVDCDAYASPFEGYLLRLHDMDCPVNVDDLPEIGVESVLANQQGWAYQSETREVWIYLPDLNDVLVRVQKGN